MKKKRSDENTKNMCLFIILCLMALHYSKYMFYLDSRIRIVSY